MSPLTAYRQLLNLAGPVYVLVAFLGRIPLAMSQLATLLLVSGATGSYGAGGLAAGAFAVANAVAAPIAGSLADRFGQRPVVLTQSLTSAVGLTALVLLAGADAALPALVAVAAAAGLVVPQVGPLARVRWRPMTARTGVAQPRLVSTAFSYEGAADEASFVLGPALVGVIGAVLNPSAALLTAAAMLLVFGTWFALHRSAEVARAAAAALADGAGAPGRLLSPNLLLLFLAQMLVGTLFGATQTGTTVLATDAGNASVAGLVHAVLGVGSVIAGLGTAALPERFRLADRLLVAAGALLVLSAPLLLVGSLPSLVLVILLLGFAVAPYMITTFTLAERLVPPRRVGAAMTLLAGATGVGYATGSAVAGRVADWGGHTPAFGVTVAATALAVVLAAVIRARTRQTVPSADGDSPGDSSGASSGGSGSACTTTSPDTARVRHT